jgi:hypothetical protein
VGQIYGIEGKSDSLTVIKPVAIGNITTFWGEPSIGKDKIPV